MTETPDALDPQSLLRQSDWLRGLARQLVRDADAAEDIVQETLVVALERPPRDQGTKGLRAWLATVARNFARRRQRSNAVRHYHEELAARSRSGGPAEGEIDRLRSQQRLTTALLALGEPHRSAVVLRFHEGLSYRSLAKRLHVSEPAARKRVSRGVALLRERLDAEHGGDRKQWCTALLVFANRPAGVATSALTIGGLTMGTKTAWTACAALLALLAGWQLTRDTEASPAPARVAIADRQPQSLESLQAPVATLDAPERAIVADVESDTLPEPPAARVPEDEDRLLRGRVTRAGEGPVAGARVEVRRDALRDFSSLDMTHDERGERIATLTTDPEGHFEVEVPPGRPYDVLATFADLAPGLATGGYPGEFLEIELQPAARLTGRVVRPDGSAVADALILGKADEAPFLERFTGATDASGRFAFDGLAPGPLRLQVRPATDAWIFRALIVLEAGRTHEETLTVEPGFTVTGRVVDASNGRPIEGAEIGQGWTFEKSARSSADGSFELRGFAPLGFYDVHARAPGYGRVERDLPAPRNGVVEIDFELEPAIRARGRLVDESGAPIEGAYVAAVSGADWRSRTTGPDGVFEIADLLPRRAYCLFAVADGYGSSAFELPRRATGASGYELGDVTLRPAARLRGRVLDVTGEPLPDVPVVLIADYADRLALSGPVEQLASSSYVDEREARTDSRGRIHFSDLAPGTYSLAAGESGQYQQRSKPVHVRAGADVQGVEIVLDAGLEIAGVVVDEAGNPVPGTAVTIYPEPPTEGRMAQVFTGAEGRFAAQGFSLGTYRIQAFPTDLVDGVRSATLLPKTLHDVDPFGTELRIVLATSSPTSGRVVDARGEAVPQAIVVAFDSGGEHLARDYTDADGRFELRLPPGAVVDIASKPPVSDGPFYTATAEFGADSATVRDVEAGTTHLRLQLPE